MLLALAATLLLSASFLAPPIYAIPSNKIPCNSCHTSGGVGSLTATYLDGTKPENNRFVISPGDTVSIVLYGLGAQDKNEPAVSLVFDSKLLSFLTIKGAAPGGEGSNAYYVRDGDPNDQDSTASNVKGVFQITVNQNAPAGEFKTTAVYEQAGPTGVITNLILKVAGQTRASSAISLLVSPLTAYANKDIVYISGGIRPKDAGQVNIEVRSGDKWQTIAVVKLGPNGAIFYQWSPSNVTQYDVRVTFEGNKNYAPAESEAFTVDVKKSPETFVDQVETAFGLGLLVILVGVGLSYSAGRGRYLRQVGVRG